jgi:hypothetical protein
MKNYLQYIALPALLAAAFLRLPWTTGQIALFRFFLLTLCLICVEKLNEIEQSAPREWIKKFIPATILLGFAFIILSASSSLKNAVKAPQQLGQHIAGVPINSRQELSSPKPEPPDVELRFVYPKTPSVLLVNTSKVVVREPKYWSNLINLNEVARAGKEAARFNFLPIPYRAGDWIRPGEALGPNEMIGMPRVQEKIVAGDVIFGSAGVTCPDCKRTAYYWVFIVIGTGGWYAETLVPSFSGLKIWDIATNPQAALDKLAPAATRVPIGDSAPPSIPSGTREQVLKKRGGRPADNPNKDEYRIALQIELEENILLLDGNLDRVKTELKVLDSNSKSTDGPRALNIAAWGNHKTTARMRLEAVTFKRFLEAYSAIDIHNRLIEDRREELSRGNPSVETLKKIDGPLLELMRGLRQLLPQLSVELK